jgi:hypothetical protein
MSISGEQQAMSKALLAVILRFLIAQLRQKDQIFVALRLSTCFFDSVPISNGKTSLVHYRTLSFFAFRLKKKRKFAFFRDLKYKITSEPVRLASIL